MRAKSHPSKSKSKIGNSVLIEWASKNTNFILKALPVFGKDWPFYYPKCEINEEHLPKKNRVGDQVDQIVNLTMEYAVDRWESEGGSIKP